MKAFSPKYIVTLVLSVLFLGTANAYAQKIKVLSISHGNTAASIKAEIVDAGQKKIKNVVARTFHMPTGASTTLSEYKVFDGRYVVAGLDYKPGNDYFYRLEVTFDDDSMVKTDCYNESYTEGAVWLSDLPVTTRNPADCAVGIDQCISGKPLQLHPTSTFEKGVSIKSVSEVSFNTALQNDHGVKFTYTKFQFGLQAYAADGSNSTAACRVIFKINGAETSSRANMKAYSNATRGSAAYFFDQTQANNNGINSVGVRIQAWGTNPATDDDYAVLGACRLYYAVPANEKEAQTITFDNQGGYIFKDNPEVQIGAYASGKTPVFYSIIQGSDIATLDENNVLRPIDNKKGEVVVEAFTLGDDTYAPASATVSYKFNFGPTVEYVYCHKDTENNKKQTLYLHVEPRNKILEKLKIEVYDNVRSFSEICTLELTSADLPKYATIQPDLYAFPITNETAGDIVHRITYKFSGEDEVTTPLQEGMNPFLYMSDIPGLNIQTGWGTSSIDQNFDKNGRLATTKYTYSKGIGLHAAGHVETPTTFDLSKFSRFVTDVGGQPVNRTRSARMSYQLYNGVSTAVFNTGNVSWQDVYEWDYELKYTSAGKTLKITVGDGADRNQNDVATIGAPRFYYITESLRAPQSLDWEPEILVNDYKAFTLQLSASATSGLPVFYRIVSGREYAKIVDGNTLSVTQMPDYAVVVIEAFQPGDKQYLPSTVKTCTYRLRKSVIVNKDERTELVGGHDVDELIIYADAKSCGQVNIKDGVVNVRNLKLKYTFTPGQWNHIAFPSDQNLFKISDLAEKGFSYSTEEGTPGTFVIREYDTQKNANTPDESPWISPSDPIVKGMKGYIMKLESEDNTPVEITFSISNTQINFDQTMCDMYLNVNMRNCEPETRHTVYVRPVNVKGNTLRVDMRFVPSDVSELPVNHARALEAMRVTHTPVRGAIRLTLPDQTPARVAIFDKDSKNLLKAVRYISPMKIDISDLKPGTYRMVVIYGSASRELTVDL